MNTTPAFYLIGTPGTPWGDAERAEWLSRQTRYRGYESEVIKGRNLCRPLVPHKVNCVKITIDFLLIPSTFASGTFLK